MKVRTKKKKKYGSRVRGRELEKEDSMEAEKEELYYSRKEGKKLWKQENVVKNRAGKDREVWKHYKNGGRRNSRGARKGKRMGAK
jgi:hypothetical protein